MCSSEGGGSFYFIFSFSANCRYLLYSPNVKYTLKLLRQARPGGRLGGGGSAADRGENLNADLPFKGTVRPGWISLRVVSLDRP
jgi:hypothetical protein